MTFSTGFVEEAKASARIGAFLPFRNLALALLIPVLALRSSPRFQAWLFCAAVLGAVSFGSLGPAYAQTFLFEFGRSGIDDGQFRDIRDVAPAILLFPI